MNQVVSHTSLNPSAHIPSQFCETDEISAKAWCQKDVVHL